MSSKPGYLIGYSRLRTLSTFDEKKDLLLTKFGRPIKFVYASRSDGLEVGDAIVSGLPNRPLSIRIGLNGLSDSNGVIFATCFITQNLGLTKKL